MTIFLFERFFRTFIYFCEYILILKLVLRTLIHLFFIIFSFLIACNCFIAGSKSASCDRYGQCSCKVGYTGRTCNRCRSGHWGYPDCKGKLFVFTKILSVFVFIFDEGIK